MISKNRIKLIKSLSIKKFRDETGLFVAEGTKLVVDLSSTYDCDILIATREWISTQQPLKSKELIECEFNELKKISNQKSPQGVIAVFKKQENNWSMDKIKNNLNLVLDDIQDPGNLGTIIRIADWFGISNVFCSKYTTDAYNPKTVQASMGALARVSIHVVDIMDFLTEIKKASVPIYGTFMNGSNIYNEQLSSSGILIMGNEGNGISSEIESFVETKLFIPNFPKGTFTSESLNVSVATALVCAEFRRRL